MSYGVGMSKTDLFPAITALVNEITADEKALAAKRDRLRALTRQWAGNAPEAEPEQAPKARRKRQAGVNVSATVVALVQRQSGLTAPQIMDKLHLREHESAVRSALKKAKQGQQLVNVNGRWYPVAPNPGPETQKAPAIKPEPKDVPDQRFAYGAANAGD